MTENTNFLYLDIETIPCQDEAKRKALVTEANPPANYKNPETIEKWRKENEDNLIAKTSFDGGLGHICQISGVSACGTGTDEFSFSLGEDIANEKSMLRSFAEIIAVDFGATIPVIVGHNVNAFDVRFLWQRAIVLGVKLPSWFPRDPKPWGEETFDTMTAWAGSRGTVSLDNLAHHLGLQGKQGIDGSMIAGMWEAGKHKEIAAYCMEDVKLVKAIHERMMEAGL